MPEPVFDIDQLFGVRARRDPAWEEAKQRLWAMTPNERVAAMHAGGLSLRLCFHWANHAPDEVPLLNGEWWFIAAETPEVADAPPPRRAGSTAARDRDSP